MTEGVQWCVIQTVDLGDLPPSVDVWGPFDTADDAFAWIDGRVAEDGVAYRPEPLGLPDDKAARCNLRPNRTGAA